MAHTTPRTPALAAFLAGLPIEPVGYVGGRPVFPIAGGSESATETTTETTGTTETGGETTGTETKTTDTTGTETGATTETTSTKVTFTPEQQAHVDTLIASKLGKEKSKYEQQLAELRDSHGKTEVEKLTAERDRYKEQAEGAPKAYGPRLAKTEAKLAATLAGARDDRLTSIVAQAKLDDAIDDDGEVDEAKVKAAIEQVLKDFPEWKGTTKRSGGDLDGGGGGPKSFTEAQIKAMSAAEYEKNEKEILEAMAAGRISKG